MTAIVHNEKQLLVKVAEGDERAFTELFRQFHPKVYQAGILLTSSPELAEELVQDIFLKLWLMREQLTRIEDFQSYLFILARNQLYGKLKRQAKFQKIKGTIENSLPAYSTETDEFIINRNYRDLLEKAIAQLTPQQQQVFRLSKLNGLKREEVAEQLQIQPNTVKEHLAKAIKHIRAYFIKQGYTPGILLLIITRL